MTKKVLQMIVAVGVYGALAAYLYEPYWVRFERWSCLIPVNHIIGALGAMVLVHRWIRSDGGRLAVGALYGFGPHFLYVTRYHPTVGLLFALLGWLFFPAAWFSSGRCPSMQRWSRLQQYLITGCLWAIPWGVCLLFFGVATYYRRFVAPVQASRLHVPDLLSLVMPLVAVRYRAVLFGVWHVPLAGLLVGLVLMIKAQRWGPLSLTCGCFALAFCPPVMGIGPVVWLSIGSLWAAVWAGLGIEALNCAGRRDVKWILAVTVLTVGFCIVTLGMGLLAPQESGSAVVLLHTGKFYALSAAVLVLLLLLMRAGWRMHALRWMLLLGAWGLDIVVSAQYVIDQI